ncbi:MAG: PEP-CTERM-box response regulator transcription factor [Candidatus Eisenbacteria bacterium]|uniref:PEP-CTERM-box response regulator transcription factor n=1 Tax=Eiseniibacteriota bacterium TaxID=2212470 RepID=A0A933SFT2_UNCEI|nr:PEP-CTERM-box response regulator transcription factor [Candidatus Eisenbacteria bacterium]
MSLEKILIVDDEDSIRNQLRWGLADEYEVHTAGSAAETRQVMREVKPGIVTLDVTLGPAGGQPEGLDLLDEIIEEYPATKVVMVTGNDSRENALAAIRRGAVDWYAKPIQLEELRVILRRAVHIRDIELAQSPDAPASRKRYHRLVGESEAMRRVFGLIQRVAPTDATVLIVGENGTGKELVAHAMHQASQRREEPFVPINCGAIPEALLESELFGHERGAFTDAYRTREGKFELADKGTLFLDEIGDLPTHLQVKLLRFLQDHVVERVGGRDPMTVDARVVAATNRDLREMRASGNFREDLFYRLSVVSILVPPLRERGDDLRLLAEYFLEFYGRQHKRKLKGFTQAALRAMAAHPWPGNVRELENRVQRAAILSQDSYLRPEDLELEPAGGTQEGLPTLQAARDEVERRLLVEALTRNAGNITRAAKDVDVSRPTLHDLMRKHGIDAARFRRPELPGADDGEDD